MKISIRNISIAAIFFFSFSVRSGDFVKHPLATALLFCTIMPTVSGGIELTDQWSFDNANAQTALGTIGFFSMSLNFISAWYYYKKAQGDLRKILQDRIDSLEKNAEFIEKYDEHFDDCFKQIHEHIKKSEQKDLPIAQ